MEKPINNLKSFLNITLAFKVFTARIYCYLKSWEFIVCVLEFSFYDIIKIIYAKHTFFMFMFIILLSHNKVIYSSKRIFPHTFVTEESKFLVWNIYVEVDIKIFTFTKIKILNVSSKCPLKVYNFLFLFHKIKFNTQLF